ncbi:MAG: alginate export family protein [Gammaproteobacteria bacterium]|nr:alginate export family protein [Gammaproteobacteria bacterium]
MFKPQCHRILVALIAIFAMSVAFAEQAASISEAIGNGKGKLSFRYRYENVDQDGFRRDADASTLKTMLSYKTATWRGWYSELEIDDVSYIGQDTFNNLRNGRTNYPVVADPNGTDINQFYLGFKNTANDLKFGRQRINLDNQRFVGGVGWRQNEQTYDALYLQNKSIENTIITVGYMDKVLRIFGPDNGAPAKKLEADNLIVNVSYKLGDLGKLVGYGYFLDMEDAPAASNSTVGVRLSGNRAFGNNKFLYTLEYADQDDYGDNPTSYSAHYYLLQFGLAFPKFTVKATVETLTGDNNAAGKAFTTPLATLHAHQGWADKFLNTPAAGIEDTYFGVSFAPWGTKVNLIYHQFDAESGSGNYGSELDISVAKKINNNFSVLLKYAAYDADDFSVDTNKLWVMLTANF